MNELITSLAGWAMMAALAINALSAVCFTFLGKKTWAIMNVIPPMIFLAYLAYLWAIQNFL